MINTEGGNGLVSGFTSYVAGEKGQLIILKNGIVPAIVPTRTVKINIEH
jgi:phosphate transport system substrate-binding protein